MEFTLDKHTVDDKDWILTKRFYRSEATRKFINDKKEANLVVELLTSGELGDVANLLEATLSLGVVTKEDLDDDDRDFLASIGRNFNRELRHSEAARMRAIYRKAEARKSLEISG